MLLDDTSINVAHILYDLIILDNDIYRYSIDYSLFLAEHPDDHIIDSNLHYHKAYNFD